MEPNQRHISMFREREKELIRKNARQAVI